MPKGQYDRDPNKYPHGLRKPITDIEHDVDLLYRRGWSQQKIADFFDLKRDRVRKMLRRTKTPLRTKANFGPKNSSWKNGPLIDKDGYVNVWFEGRRVLEHRLVMEQLIGRPLDPKEVVHHKNKDKQDNRPENLLLFRNNGEHLGVELLGKCPNWTEEGRKKIAQRAKPQFGKNHQKGIRGVLRSRRKLIQQFLHDTSGLVDTGAVASLPPLPPVPPRAKPHETDGPPPSDPEQGQ